MARTAPSPRAVLRALWLLGLEPPVERAELQAAWRQRVARTHPDRHAGEERKAQAAEVLTRALNEARETLEEWIESGRPWPQRARNGDVEVPLNPYPPEPWPERAERRTPGPADETTGLRPGDLVRLWPFDGDEVEVVSGVERDGPRGPTWVSFEAGGAQRAGRVRLASFQCPVCGDCAGPIFDEPALRPCPACLIDLRRLAKAPREADRIRRAIEARAQAGKATAEALDDQRLIDRASDRVRWARRLSLAGPDDLHAALLERFSRAYEAWGAER